MYDNVIDNKIYDDMKIAVIGATGVVGQKMLQVLEEQNLSFDELIVAASEKSIGKKILFKDKK